MTPPLAWSLGQGLAVGAIRALVLALAMGGAFAWVGWPVAGAALAVASTAVEAWARRREPGTRTLLLAGAWSALLGAFAVGWGFLQGIYFTVLWRTGSLSEAREGVLVAYRGVYDAALRKAALWKEVLPWLQRDEGDPRTPLLVLAAAAGVVLIARLLRHRPLAFRGGPWVRGALSPVALPLLGLLPTLLVSTVLLRERLVGLLAEVCFGVSTWQHATEQAALALALLAGFALSLAGSVGDLAARAPRGEPSGSPPGPWSWRLLLPALAALWLGFVTVPARGWPSARDEALARVARGDAVTRATALEELRKLHRTGDDPEVLAAGREAVRDPDPLVRAAGFELLRLVAPRDEFEALVRAWALEPDPALRSLAWHNAYVLDEEEAAAMTRAALGGAQAELRADALGQGAPGLPREERLRALVDGFADPDPLVRRAALEGTWQIDHAGHAALRDGVRRLLADPDPGVRRVAPWALPAVTGSVREVPELEEMLASPDPKEHATAVEVLARLTVRDPAGALSRLLVELERELAADAELHAAEALGQVGVTAADAVPRLRALLQRDLRPDQREAIEAAIRAIELE